MQAIAPFIVPGLAVLAAVALAVLAALPFTHWPKCPRCGRRDWYPLHTLGRYVYCCAKCRTRWHAASNRFWWPGED